MAIDPEIDAEHDDPRESRRNLHARICGAMTGLPAAPGANEVWIVLRPIANNDWNLRRNPANANGPPSTRFVFRDQNAASKAARPADKVEGGWAPPPSGGSKEVDKVVVHFDDGSTDTFEGDTYDAVFWTVEAKVKFLNMYYAATLGNIAVAVSAAPVGHEKWSRSSEA